MKVWKLKKGHDFRIRTRHPWVFSNELLDSPKSILAGEAVELHDFQDYFLARGYGNPHSLIAFRALSFNGKESFELNAGYFAEKLLHAWEFREKNSFHKSFRLCFSEADYLSGLIVDRYVFQKENKTYQVFSYQLLTAGMDRIFQQLKLSEPIFKLLTEQSINLGFSKIPWENTLLLQKNDVSIRKLEGLEVQEPIVIRSTDGCDLTNISIQIQNAFDSAQTLNFSVNLVDGQKTGFFLDQTFNMNLLLKHLNSNKDKLKGKTLKILDLCCYMGQWSSQVVANLKSWGLDAEVHLVDVSEMALQKAKANLDGYSVKVFTYKVDVLRLEDVLSEHASYFDVVISDPPAFVKNKKDLNSGLHAYAKLNQMAFKLTVKGGVVVSCTCSGLVSLEDFKESLRKAVLKSGKSAKCIAYGGQGWDHPNLMCFPEGYYLKMILHQVDNF